MRHPIEMCILDGVCRKLERGIKALQTDLAWSVMNNGSGERKSAPYQSSLHSLKILEQAINIEHHHRMQRCIS